MGSINSNIPGVLVRDPQVKELPWRGTLGTGTNAVLQREVLPVSALPVGTLTLTLGVVQRQRSPRPLALGTLF